MKTLEIKGALRQDLGKKESKDLRKQELVPCVMYGGEKNLHFSAHENQFKKLVYTPDVYLVKLEVDGQAFDAVMQEIQFHPVSDSIIHIDFVQVFPDKKVTVNLPVRLTGSSVGLLEGGKLRQRRHYLKVNGLIKDMPDRLEIDLTDMNIGESIKIGDLVYDNLEILDPPRAMVVGVVSSRLIAKGLREALPEEVEEVAAEEVEEGEAPPTDEAPAAREGAEEAPAAEEEKSSRER
ncbi:MAG: 50S ribosomal protein L25/general stress protein Ctc [Bacteroidales bacterium]|nr:50S ribosomal protein L25/general stress protein Ctc [Bacteroidales bacterium]